MSENIQNTPEYAAMPKTTEKLGKAQLRDKRAELKIEKAALKLKQKQDKKRKKAQKKLAKAENRWQLAAFKRDIKDWFKRRKKGGKQ